MKSIDYLCFSNVDGITVRTAKSQNGNIIIETKPDNKRLKRMVFTQQSFFDLILCYMCDYDLDKVKDIKNKIPESKIKIGINIEKL